MFISSLVLPVDMLPSRFPGVFFPVNSTSSTRGSLVATIKQSRPLDWCRDTSVASKLFHSVRKQSLDSEEIAGILRKSLKSMKARDIHEKGSIDLVKNQPIAVPDVSESLRLLLIVREFLLHATRSGSNKKKVRKSAQFVS